MDEEKQLPFQRGINALVTVLLVLAVLLCLYVVIQVLSYGYVNIAGFSLFRVVTGSMEPTIRVGALMVCQEVDIAAVGMDDIICFRTREEAIFGSIVTHRVVGILEGLDGSLLLETKGDANLAMDGYYVTQENLLGKVIWYTGDKNVLASIFSFFTNKIGFLACIVIPCLLLAGLIMRDCVRNIRNELQLAMEELQYQQTAEEPDPLCGMTQEEYDEMYARIRAELLEELMLGVQQTTEQENA